MGVGFFVGVGVGPFVGVGVGFFVGVGVGEDLGVPITGFPQLIRIANLNLLLLITIYAPIELLLNDTHGLRVQNTVSPTWCLVLLPQELVSLVRPAVKALVATTLPFNITSPLFVTEPTFAIVLKC